MAASGYGSRLWQSEDGLPHTIVQAITQTKDSYLWVGTREGLARFDGIRFELIELAPDIAHANISALHGARDGSLWIGTEYRGVFRLSDGKISRWSAPSGVKDFSVTEIQESTDGLIWINSSEGVLRVENGKFEAQAGLKTPQWAWTSIAADKDGTVWALIRGLKRLQGTNVMEVTGTNLPAGGRKLYCGRNGVIWAGVNSGLTSIKNGVGTFYRKADGPSGYVSVIKEDRDGNVWVGTYLGLYQFVDGQFINQAENEEAFYRVYCIFEDREGSIWAGSEEGLTRYTRNRFTSFTKRHGLTQNNIVTVCPSRDGGVWIGVWGGGVNYLKDGQVTVYNRTNGLATDLIMALCESRDGSLWIGTDGGVGLHQLRDGKIIRHDKEPGLQKGLLPVNTALAEDCDGGLWVGTRDLIYRFADGRYTPFTTKDGLSNNKINAICETRDKTIWLGTDEGITKRENGHFSRLTAKGPSLDAPVFSLYEDADQTLWIGTKETGLGRLKDGTLDLITSQRGLFSDSIYSILDDARGNLWLNSSKGIFYVSKKEIDEVIRGKTSSVTCVSFGKLDGIVSSSGQYREVTQPAACKSTDGRLWFRTTQGVAMVDPENIAVNKLPPPVVIETVIADKSKTQLAGRTAITIPPGRGELEIHYTALSFRAPERNRFKYQLVGADPDWVDAADRRVAYYNNLDPREYRFRVMASNNDGVWNETGAAIALALQPHFWQTRSFVAICLLAGIAGIAGTARYVTWRKMQRKLERLEAQHAIEKERSRIARDMHDELGAKLTRISFQGASAKRGLGNPAEVVQQIEKMSQTARDLVSSLDEIVWAVDPENDSLDHLATYISRHASEYFEHSPISCHLVIPTNLPHRRLATDVRHNIYLAVKEALTNVLKHSEATRVEVRLAVHENEFEIGIADNGRGFDPNSIYSNPPNVTRRTGHGLTNIRERLGAVNGRCEVKSVVDGGTEMRFFVPLSPIDEALSSIHPTPGGSRWRV